MKKSLLALTVALSFGLAAAQTAAPASAPQVPALTDVPAGHWAKDAIDRLVSRGIILGYPDGTYRGTQNLTRYEAAVIIARLLDQIKAGEVVVAPAEGGINAEDLVALQNAVQELAADLAALGVRVSDLEQNAVSKDDLAALEARINELGAAQGDQEAIANIQAQLDELTARADEYDTMRADVDDAMSSIAALNDLTVLLNQDILDLQDRVSAVEAAQADFVLRSDYDNLSGRVTAVETSIKDVNNRIDSVNSALGARITNLEKNAFTIKPTLTVGYTVSRSTRDFDIDRLFPWIKGTDGTYTKLQPLISSGNLDPDNGGKAWDFGDFGKTGSAADETTKSLAGFANDRYLDYREGETTIGFGLTFATSGQFTKVTSQSGGSLFTTAGKLTINDVNVDFGLTTAPDSTAVTADGRGWEAVYPKLTDDAGYTYRPMFLKFKNATANFSVGNNPVIVTLGRNMKYFFADYGFDNDIDGRGDGFKVVVDGSNVPVIGAWKPTLTGVYGSRKGANGDGIYYRGIRGEITPIDTLKMGVHYVQEGQDAFGAANTGPSDVTLIGADAHGKLFGVELHSEYEYSRVNPYGFLNGDFNADSYNASAFYARMATRNADKSFDLNKPAAKFGTDMVNFSIYDLNYRNIDAAYDKVAALSESDFNSASSTSQQNLSFGYNDGRVTAPFANLVGRTGLSPVTYGHIGQKGFGVKAALSFGASPINAAVGGYYDTSTGSNGSFTNSDPNLLTEYGASAKLGLSIFSVRGDYNYILNNRILADGGSTGEARRYAVQADVNPGLGFSIGAYYRNVEAASNGAALAKVTSSSLFNLGYLKSYFKAGTDNTYYSGLNCSELQGDLGRKDIDGVGNVLNPTATYSRNSVCFSAYGIELAHNGGDKNALVKGLDARVGFGAVYRPATNAYDGRIMYGNIGYSQKVGVADIRVAGSYSSSNLTSTEVGTGRYAGTRGAFGVMVQTDPLANLPFKPSLNGQFGYYTSTFDADNNPATPSLGANAMKYGAGVTFQDVLLPDTKIGVRYDGYTSVNRAYVPYDGAGTTGYFQDAANNTRINLNGVYVEGAYKDLIFSYGQYTLSGKDATTGVEQAIVNPLTGARSAAKGQTFKISYKVNF